MIAANVPSRFPIPFANAAGPSYIRPVPRLSQIGIQDGAASLTDGFPPVTFIAVGAGGTPPYGEDFNGLLNQITAWSQWQAAGGPIVYDSVFSAAVNGYPLGAFLTSSVTAGLFWISTVDNNTTDPDGLSPANWTAAVLKRATGSQVLTGTADDIVITPKALRDASPTVAGTDISRTTPDGYIEKLGDVYYPSGVGGEPSIPITFAAAFPTSILYVGLSVYVHTTGFDTSSNIWVQEVRPLRSIAGFTAQAQAASSGQNFYGFSWRALGK